MFVRQICAIIRIVLAESGHWTMDVARHQLNASLHYCVHEELVLMTYSGLYYILYICTKRQAILHGSPN